MVLRTNLPGEKIGILDRALKKLEKITGKNINYYEYDGSKGDQFTAAHIFFRGRENEVCIFNQGLEPVFDIYSHGGRRDFSGFRLIPDYVDIWTSSIGPDIPDHWHFVPFWQQFIDGCGGAGVLPEYTSQEERKTKIFCWMRRHHSHRIDLANALYESSNIQDIEFVFPHYSVEYDVADGGDKSHLKNMIKDWENMRPYISDTPVGVEYGYNPADVPAWNERQSRYLELVCETSARYEKIKQTFFSEKTFRVFRAGQLALFWGQPYTATYMKDYGFKIHEKWINHEYDTIEDYNLRLDMLMKEIKRLNSLSMKQWHEMWKETHADRIHNQVHKLNNPNLDRYYEHAKIKHQKEKRSEVPTPKR